MWFQGAQSSAKPCDAEECCSAIPWPVAFQALEGNGPRMLCNEESRGKNQFQLDLLHESEDVLPSEFFSLWLRMVKRRWSSADGQTCFYAGRRCQLTYSSILRAVHTQSRGKGHTSAGGVHRHLTHQRTPSILDSPLCPASCTPNFSATRT